MNTMKSFMILLIVLSICGFSSANVQFWGKTGSANEEAVGNWTTASRWDEYAFDAFGDLIPTGRHIVPGTSDANDVAFIDSGEVQVTSVVNAFAGLVSTDGDIRLSGGKLSLVGSETHSVEGYGNLDIARGGDSTLIISGGTLEVPYGSAIMIGKAVDDIHMATGIVDQTSGQVNAYRLYIGEIAYDDVENNGYDLSGTPQPWPWHFAGEGIYTISGGSIQVDDLLTVGKGTSGTLNVSGTANISADKLIIGAQSNSSGVLNVSGGYLGSGYALLARDVASEARAHVTGGTFNATTAAWEKLEIGRYGTAEFHLEGGTVQVDWILLGAYAGSKGTLHLSGGTLASDGTIRAGQGDVTLKISGSQTSPIVLQTGKLEFGNKPDAKLWFGLDAGGVTPIKVPYGNGELQGAQIYVETLPGYDGDPTSADPSENTYDVVIAQKILVDQNTAVHSVSPTCTFSYRVVEKEIDGLMYQVLQLKLESKIEDCEGMLQAGLTLPGDISGALGLPDCTVDMYDLTVLAEDWLDCVDPEDNCI